VRADRGDRAGAAGAEFPAEQVAIAQEVANQMAIAITQARLHERVERQAAELERRVEERTRALEGANRELEAFSYTVSHDLKAPLRGMEGFARALDEDYADRLDDTGRRYLQMIRASAIRMGQLIDDLLRYSRIERRAGERRPVLLKPLLDQLYEELAGEIRARGLTLTEDLAVPEVMAEKEGIRRRSPISSPTPSSSVRRRGARFPSARLGARTRSSSPSPTAESDSR